MKENSFSLMVHVDPSVYKWDMNKLRDSVKNAISKTLNDRYGGYMLFDIVEVKE